MRVVVLVKASRKSESGALPDQQILRDMGRFNEELVKAGVMLAGEGLKASSAGKRLRFEGPKRTVIDGPFAETKELVAGFWIWQVKSMEEAMEWAKRCPPPMPGEVSELEIRPVMELEDLAGVQGAGEVVKKEAELRREIEARQGPAARK